MKLNVVCFDLPMPRVYQKLPPHHDEISEVLAFTFTESKVPGSEELKCTSILVQRNKVADALEWLKLNHSGYLDLNILYKNLESYNSEQPSITIICQESTDHIDPLTKSVYSNDSDDGVENGPCSFTVSG